MTTTPTTGITTTRITEASATEAVTPGTQRPAHVARGEVAFCFPLVAWPRPACPPLRTRLDQVANAARAAVAATDRQVAVREAGRALTEAAAIARDCGKPDLAQRIGARHIALYTDLTRPLTSQEAKQVVGSATSLARAHLHTDPDRGVAMLVRILDATRGRLAITLDNLPKPLPLPLGDVDSALDEHRKLVALAQAQLMVSGTVALARAGRWAGAAELARTYGGIGNRLLEGRQALIISRLLDRDGNGARALVAGSDTVSDADRDVASCLTALCAASGLRHEAASAMVDRYRAGAGLGERYASYRARYGAAVAVIARADQHLAAPAIAAQAATEALESGDGYAAQEVLRHSAVTDAISDDVRAGLDQVVKAAGLSGNALIGRLPTRLEDAVDLATHAVRPDL
ncbi:hypothetical protein ACFT2C_04330 [Promicromonospora sp. NPDC057138]|uniref:hypothetical protein n=1 Tax=Promicromonospora sp. NPDC057138 TaxID=3346031 RepID=UPI0036437AED